MFKIAVTKKLTWSVFFIIYSTLYFIDKNSFICMWNTSQYYKCKVQKTWYVQGYSLYQVFNNHHEEHALKCPYKQLIYCIHTQLKACLWKKSIWCDQVLLGKCWTWSEDRGVMRSSTEAHREFIILLFITPNWIHNLAWKQDILVDRKCWFLSIRLNE